MVNKKRLIEQIADLVNDKKIEGIGDLRDESDREGMRIVIELKRDAVAEIVINQLYKHTALQDSFGVNMLAIVDGKPKLLNLKEALKAFLDHRKEVVTRRTAYDLRKAEERLHILEGYRIALDNLDAVIALIRNSSDPRVAKEGLMSNFALSDIQAQAILDLRLQRLTGLERDKIMEEHRETVELIGKLRAILADEKEIYRIIVEELKEIKKKYGDERRTQIVDRSEEISIEDTDRRRRHGGDDLPRRLHQAQSGHPLSRAAARRQGQDRHDDERGRLCRVPVYRVDAFLHPLFHHHRKSLLDQSARAAAGEPGGAGQTDRQSAQS